MTLGERIRAVRNAMELTQKQFAARLNMKRNTIGNYETDTFSPSDRTLITICKEFHISETWLRTGEGEMFAPKPVGTLDRLAEERGLTTAERLFVEKFLDMDPAARQAVFQFMKDFVASLRGDAVQPKSDEDRLRELLDKGFDHMTVDEFKEYQALNASVAERQRSLEEEPEDDAPVSLPPVKKEA